MAAIVYLIPTVLADQQTECLPAYLLDAVKASEVFYVENLRTARRYLKLLWKEMPIDNYEWFSIQEVTVEIRKSFQQHLQQGKKIAIISEAGCPGVADPGQTLVEMAQKLKITVKPLVGPSSILLALMASGMNGQQFQFSGYLPIENADRIKQIRALEIESKQRNSTQIFIETPYRNNQLMEALLKTLHPETRLCVAVDLTAPAELIKTLTIKDWHNQTLNLHKRPAIFLLYAGSEL